MIVRIIILAGIHATLLAGALRAAVPLLPAGARLTLDEDWSDERIDTHRWCALRKKWGEGNNGVVPENVRIVRDTVNGREQPVLLCVAHGDLYDGLVTGYRGIKTRVGGVLVSRQWFASGRFEVIMKIGGPVGASEQMLPSGAVPAIWTYGHRAVRVPDSAKDQFHRDTPLYNPHLKAYGRGINEYWSEVDFPELGKNGDFTHGLYNTFCQNRYDWQTFAVPEVADGKYHTFTTEWRTTLIPLTNITDAQVIPAEGYWWVQDRAVPFDLYLGNPLKRLAPNHYSVYAGKIAEHWIDGKRVGENTRHVPCMAAQLNLGIWLPKWAGNAPWKTANVSFASIKVWQYNDSGDVHHVLRDDISNNFDEQGNPR